MGNSGSRPAVVAGGTWNTKAVCHSLAMDKKIGEVLRVPRPKHPGQDPIAAETFKKDLTIFGLHTETRRVWITKGVGPIVSKQTRYEWDYLYGTLEVVEGKVEFLHLPTVNLDCNRLFLEHLKTSDSQAHPVVIADQAGFHLRPGDSRLPTPFLGGFCPRSLS